MSVKTKMTAIADKLRALQGTTGTLSLDGMAAALDTQQTQVQSAFSAVAEMDGTVPVTQRASTLPDAIRTIPTGVTVRRKSGTFTTSTSGTASVNCGFKPDLVMFKVGTSSTDSKQNDPAFAFTESAKTALSITSVPLSGVSGVFMSNVCTQTSTGFSITIKSISSSWDVTNVSRKTFNYIAVKYTE